MGDRRHLPKAPVNLVRRRRQRTPDDGHEVHTDGSFTPSRSGVVDSAVYRAGERRHTASSLTDCYDALRDQSDGMAWIGLYRPGSDELHSLAAEFDLHELAVEDAITAHQRPKLERYGERL